MTLRAVAGGSGGNNPPVTVAVLANNFSTTVQAPTLALVPISIASVPTGQYALQAMVLYNTGVPWNLALSALVLSSGIYGFVTGATAVGAAPQAAYGVSKGFGINNTGGTQQAPAFPEPGGVSDTGWLMLTGYLQVTVADAGPLQMLVNATGGANVNILQGTWMMLTKIG